MKFSNDVFVHDDNRLIAKKLSDCGVQVTHLAHQFVGSDYLPVEHVSKFYFFGPHQPLAQKFADLINAHNAEVEAVAASEGAIETLNNGMDAL